MKTTEIVKLDPKEFGIEPQQATELMTNLPLIKKEREPLIVRFNEVSEMDVSSPETAKLAREVRLAIRDNRTKGIMDWHKKSKEVFLRGGQFVDAIKNQEIAINERMESLLADVEKHSENLEKARLEKLQEERLEMISPYIEDTTGLQLGTMEEDVFEAYVFLQKKKYEDRIEAEKEAEKQRIAKEKAEEAERKKVRLENEKLKAEAEKREKEIEAERKKQQEIQAEKDRVLAQENAKREKELEAERKRIKAEADKKEAEANAKLEAERKEKEALQAQIKAEKDAEDKLKAEAKLEAEKLAKAPIKKQMKIWVDSFNIPEINIENEKKKLISEKFEAFKKWAVKEIETL